MNVILRGKTKEVLENMVEEGYANTMSEAIRLTIINFGQTQMTEQQLVSKKLDKIDREIKTGSRKTLNAKEALGEYAKYVKQ